VALILRHRCRRRSGCIHGKGLFAWGG